MSKIIALLGKLPPELIEAIYGVIVAVVKADNPKRAAERAAKAAAGRTASWSLLRRLLG